MITKTHLRSGRKAVDDTVGLAFPAPAAGSAISVTAPQTPPTDSDTAEIGHTSVPDPDDGRRSVLPANHPAATGQVALLAGRASATAIASGAPTALSADEVRRVERSLIVAMSSGVALPSMRNLAGAAGVTKHRLRRAIGTVELAAQAIVDERFAIARTCTEMPTGWHPSLEVLGGRLVTHRLFVYSIIIDVVEAAEHSTATAGEFVDLERALADELRYQVGRWQVFGDADVEEFVTAVEGIFSFARIRSIDHSTREQLERRLNHDLGQVFERFAAVERWNESRHEWFDLASELAARPVPARIGASSPVVA